MTNKHYLSFVKRVKNWLKWQGIEELETREDRYLHLKQLNEDIYIPLFYIGFVNIYYVYNGEVQDVFRSNSKYLRNAAKQFAKFHRERNFRKVLSNDNELQASF